MQFLEYNQIMKTSRQQIFEFIQAHRVVTVADISQVLQMTRANARHHLNILQEQGLVEVVGHRLMPGKGRPANLYGVSNFSLGNNLPLLLDALLHDLKNSLSQEQYDLLLHRVTIHFINQNPPGGLLSNSPTDLGKNLTQRLYDAIQFLNKLNYYARWEAHSDAPRVILDHCPYLAILDDNPELCQIDKHLIKELVNAQVVQTSKLIQDARGVPHCIFQIIGTSNF